ncbi:MAG: SAM-dependent methyltransferase [Saprospiraceae bacterium]|nr:SAM-dependent methyltransferase [Bacteroidia bacterium]NNE14315.1 SAM-dependent methyltransferase [Saprospiraceae bacterium]NNL90837.1 SAM-dependent methyltransferase [Saprospiraceae bacterium]
MAEQQNSSTDKLEVFLSDFSNSFENEKLISVRLMDNKTDYNEVKQIIIKPVNLKKGHSVQFVFRKATQDITKNHSLEESVSIINENLKNGFHQAEMITKDQNFYLSRTNNSNWKLKQKEIKNEPISIQHDKNKNRLIPSSAPYLFHLGITDENGKIKKSMHSKFRQINKFVEIVSGLVNPKDFEEPFTIYDMGCGKGYLSFALYDHFSKSGGDNLKLRGIELRPGLVASSNQIAEKCGCDNLLFEEGFIQEYTMDSAAMLIALHACNTATDDAIHKGIISKAKYIICSPCCHKQVRQNLNKIDPIHSITKFGILKERQAEILTDTIRALILEAFGYKTNVMEFISSEHTSKNLLIVAKKVKNVNSADLKKLEEIKQLKQVFGLDKHHLETLLFT